VLQVVTDVSEGSVFRIESETGEAGLSMVIANKVTWQYGAKHHRQEKLSLK